jgi:DNA-binding MarR family transcriptional regulator
MVGGVIKEEEEPGDKQASNGETGDGDGQLPSTSRDILNLPLPLPVINIEHEPDDVGKVTADAAKLDSTTAQQNGDKRSYTDVVKGVKNLKDRAKVTVSALKLGRRLWKQAVESTSASAAAADKEKNSPQLSVQRLRDMKGDGSALALMNNDAIDNNTCGKQPSGAHVPVVDDDNLFIDFELPLPPPSKNIKTPKF